MQNNFKQDIQSIPPNNAASSYFLPSNCLQKSFMAIFGANLLLEVILQEREIRLEGMWGRLSVQNKCITAWQRQQAPVQAVLKLYEGMLFATGNIFFIEAVWMVVKF